MTAFSWYEGGRINGVPLYIHQKSNIVMGEGRLLELFFFFLIEKKGECPKRFIQDCYIFSVCTGDTRQGYS